MNDAANQPPDTLDRPPQRRFARRLILLGAVAIILLGGFFGARPAYRAFKGWRSKNLAAQAEKLFAQNEWPRGVEKAQSALLLKRTEPAAVRAMARALTHATNAAALAFWQQLNDAGQATIEERRGFVELAIRLGSLGQATLELRKLLATGPNDAKNLWLASQLYAAVEDYSQTVYYATRAQLLDPQNRQYQLFLSSLLFDSTDAQKQSEARTNVWAIARDNGPMGLEALGFLARRLDLSADQRRELIVLLKQHPSGSMQQQLLILEQRMRLEPERRPEILDAAVAQYKAAGKDLVAFAAWLNRNEEFQRTLAAAPLDAALQSKELFIPHLEALASLGRWEELENILDTKRTPLEKVYVEAFRARAAMKLGRVPTAAVHWRSALFSAERNPEQLHWLALYSEKCGEIESAKKAHRSLIGCLANVRPAYQALLRLTARSGTTKELRDLLGEMLRQWPDDPALRNDHAYLNLLLGNELAASRQAAEELVKQFPESLPYRTTLALACFRLKDFPAALRAYEDRQYDWSLALPGNRAVHAAVLAATGNPELARDHARSLPREPLRAEEMELIRTLL